MNGFCQQNARSKLNSYIETNINSARHGLISTSKLAQHGQVNILAKLTWFGTIKIKFVVIIIALTWPLKEISIP